MVDVADLAGVSLKTVSRVMNGVSTVDPLLTQRVMAAADSLNFVPNFAARNLRSRDGLTHQVAAILADPVNPFLGVILDSLQSVATERKSLLLAATAGKISLTPSGGSAERDLVRAFVTRRVDGLILSPTAADQAYLEPIVAAGTPVVCVDHPATNLKSDVVAATNYDGAVQAVRHLVEAGHRRIGYLGDISTLANSAERFRGYSDALNAAGLGYWSPWIAHDLSNSALAEAAATRILSSPDAPSALFTSQNLVSIGAVRALRALGLKDHIAQVGFDDFPMADLLEPAVTVIVQDVESMARKAAELLFERIDGDTSAFQTIEVPTKLVMRGSGEIAPEPRITDQ